MDFMLKAARERESSNKRKIKPKAIDDDDLLLIEDSDDSDFNVGSGADSAVEEDTSDGDSAGSGSGSDGSDDDDGSSEEDDDSSEEDSKGTSALREGFKKFEDTPVVRPKKRKRKKPVAKKAKDEDEGKSNGIKDSEEPGDTLANGPSQPKKKKPAPKKKKKKKGDDESKGKKKLEVKKKKDVSEKRKSKSILNKVKKMDDMTSDTRSEIDLRVRICSFCLGTSSDGSNEIVECDSCGVTVHEVCYGVSDTASVSSGTESSNSTEPWFCDACKSSCEKVSCDLCPVRDGLFKETNTGRFVHLVCAMYTPGVRVLDDGVPDLREIPVATWGSYFCNNCDDERNARTGIGIRCDAGLCKNYLHATCAQEQGLLSDPNAVDPENPVADPYYVSCRLHCPKKSRKKRAENYDILQEQRRVRKEQKAAVELTDVQKAEQNRILKKIDKFRTKSTGKYSYTRSEGVIQLPPIISPTTSDALSPNSADIPKKSRHVDSSTTSDRFFTKAVLAGANLKSLELEDKKERIVATIGKKWNVLPALTVEFAAYYSDRENRLESLVEQVDTLEDQKGELADLHTGIKNVFETMGDEHKDLLSKRDSLVKNLTELEQIVKYFNPEKKFETGIPASLVNKKRRHSGSPNRKSPASKRDKGGPSSSSRRKSKVHGASPNGSQSPPGRLKILRCDVCNKSEDQHLITKCDKCKRCFHLGCLDPPLTRMPKRTRIFGWMCSDCGDETEEDSEAEVDTEAPRSLRGRESLKRPNKYLNIPATDVPVPTVNGTIKKPATPKEKSAKTHSSPTRSSPKPSPPKKSPKSSPKTQKASTNSINHHDYKEPSGSSEGKCVTCCKIDIRKNMVICDKCSEEFHFGCLDPPLKYTPKRRGYSWFCVNCDDEEGNEERSELIALDDDDSLEIVSS